MNPYSPDLRSRIVAAYQQGEGSALELADRFAVSSRTVERYLARFRATGSLDPTPYRHGPKRRLRVSEERALTKLLKAKNDRTDAEYAEALERETGVHVSSRTINRTWERLGVTRKKNPSTRASRTDLISRRPGVASDDVPGATWPRI